MGTNIIQPEIIPTGEPFLTMDSSLQAVIGAFELHMQDEGFSINTQKAFLSDLRLLGKYLGIGQPIGDDSDEPLPMVTPSGPQVSRKITAFGKEAKHEENWNRTPNTTGSGAIHVRTFHCKLTDDALTYLDQMVNEWLDAHPQYEVKFAITTVGILTGKLKEPHMIVQVWV